MYHVCILFKIVFPSHPSITVAFPVEIDTIQMSFDRWVVENDLFNVLKNEDVDWQPSDVALMQGFNFQKL